MKKFLALFLALMMLATMTALTASAAGTAVDVTLVAENEVGAVAGSTYSVTLEIADATVGGVQGTVKYDNAKFDFVDITMAKSVADANHITGEAKDAFKVNEEAGTIDYILLCDRQNKNLATFNFTVLADKVGTADFTVTGVKVANAAGTDTVDNTPVDAKDIKVSPVAIRADSTSIRTNGQYDLRFKTTIDADFAAKYEIKEVGMILIPTSLIAEGKEVVNDETGAKFCVEGVTPQIAKISYKADFNVYYANINNTATSHMNRRYSLRAFVVLENDTVVYSDNEADNKPIQNGTISRSCKTTAIALYDLYKDTHAFSAEAKEIAEGKANEKWTADEYKIIAKENLEALKADLAANENNQGRVKKVKKYINPELEVKMLSLEQSIMDASNFLEPNETEIDGTGEDNGWARADD